MSAIKTTIDAILKLNRCQATLLKVNKEDLTHYFIERYGPDYEHYHVAALVETVEILTDEVIRLREHIRQKEVRE